MIYFLSVSHPGLTVKEWHSKTIDVTIVNNTIDEGKLTEASKRSQIISIKIQITPVFLCKIVISTTAGHFPCAPH